MPHEATGTIVSEPIFPSDTGRCVVKETRLLVGLLLAGGLVSAAFAGGAGYKCTKTTDECLNAMVSDMKTRGWIGCELDKDESGALVVKRVVAGTPAEAAGIQVGDQFIAMNGIKFGDDRNMEALYAAKKNQPAPAARSVPAVSAGYIATWPPAHRSSPASSWARC